MKFKTFAFEGTKIRAALADDFVVLLVADDLRAMLGYPTVDSMLGGALRDTCFIHATVSGDDVDCNFVRGLGCAEFYQMARICWSGDDARIRRLRTFLVREVESWREESMDAILAQQRKVGSDTRRACQENTARTRRQAMRITSKSAAELLGVTHDDMLDHIDGLIDKMNDLYAQEADRAPLVMFSKYEDTLGYDMNEIGFVMLAGEFEDVESITKTAALVAIHRHLDHGTPLRPLRFRSDKSQNHTLPTPTHND